MPLIRVEAQPGFNSQVTQVQSAGRWWIGNLVRWRQGLLEKLPGWKRLVENPFAHHIRRMHAWLDLEDHKNLLIGTDVGLELYHDDDVDHTRHVLVETVVLPDPRKSTWHLANLGEDGLALTTHGPLLVYHPADEVPSVQPVPTAPLASHGMLTAMPQAQVILWGTEAIIGDPTTLDPLLIRFSDAGTYDTWIATVSNQAGSYRLSRGSRIMGAVQAPQTTLIFTDTDVWAMSYIGPPLVYGFTIMGTGCGLVAPHAVVTHGRTTYWQGQDGIWQFGDSGVQSLDCALWDYMFQDLDVENIYKCNAGANSYSDEVTFYFPSVKDPFRTGAEEVDGTILSNEPWHYVKYNTKGPWDGGKLGRTAWINNNIFGPPLGADLNFRVQQHETGYDDDDQPMRGVFAETGYADIGDGSQMLMVDQCQPDFKWLGKNGGLSLTLRGLSYAGSKQRSYGPFSMTETTQFFNPRARARHMALRFDWAERRGFSARIGATLLRAKPAGKRP